MVMQQLANAASKKEYLILIDWFFFLLRLVLQLIDALARDKIQNLAIHLVTKRKQLYTLNRSLSKIEPHVETSTSGASSEEKEWSIYILHRVPTFWE